jgi:hypothetical protein
MSLSMGQPFGSFYYHHYGSTALCWAFVDFSVSLSYTQSVVLLGRGISPPQGLYLHIEQHKHGINAHNTDIHALSGIRTHDSSVQASEDSSCLRPRGHCDWRGPLITKDNYGGASWSPPRALWRGVHLENITVVQHVKKSSTSPIVFTKASY